jgi:hypothetical protein
MSLLFLVVRALDAYRKPEVDLFVGRVSAENTSCAGVSANR